MLTWLKQRLCSHRYDLADLMPRDAAGMVRCRCYKCGAINEADCGLHLPGAFDRNSRAPTHPRPPAPPRAPGVQEVPRG